MKLDFSDKTALITGASRGIGHRIATDLAACGAKLIVTSTTPDPGAKLIQDFGPDTQHVAADFADRSSMSDFLEFVRALPDLHVCVNNAGATRHGPLQDASEEDWDMTNDVNLKAPFFVSQAAAEVMTRGGYGRIVNVTSIWAHMTMAGRSVYTATKFGLRGLTLSYALELARANVLVNVVAPGFTLTDMVRQNYSKEQLAELESRIPMGRLATVDDISHAVLFLASDLNSYITGQSLLVDGGYSIA